MSPDKPRWALRPPEAADIAFIFSSWLKSYRDAPAVAGVPNTIYYKKMHAIIERALARSAVVVACDPGEPQLIFGWGVGEQDTDVLTLHFIYSKHAFRKFGLGSAIEQELLKLPHKAVAYSTRTAASMVIVRSRPTYIFNPFKLWSE